MGEYARRISDNKEIKIGTCEDIYLHYEDRFSVEPIEGSSFGCWRLPLPQKITSSPVTTPILLPW